MNLKSLSGVVLGRVQMRDSQLRETPFATREEKVSGGIFTATREPTQRATFMTKPRGAAAFPMLWRRATQIPAELLHIIAFNCLRGVVKKLSCCGIS
jgi:hypothetical protein